MAVNQLQPSRAAVSTSEHPQPVPMLDLNRQYQSIKDELHAAVERVLASQHFIGGAEVEAFEHESAEYLGVRASVGCASGTDALWLALVASGVDANAGVVTTPFSFFASVSSVVRCGATPILADVDPATLNLEPQRVEAALQRGRNIRAVMPVHLYGQCADMDRFGQLAEEYKVAIIEDAAQAFGASWKDKKAGSFGEAAAFSFYPTKNLSACGDGGCVTTDNEHLAAHVRRLRNHGSERRYYHQEIGWNSRLDVIQAAILRIKLRHLDDWNQRRRIAARRYQDLFTGAGLVQAQTQTVSPRAPIALLAASPDAYHIYHQFVLRALDRDQLRNFLTERGIGSEIYYPLPLHLQECFTYLGYKAGDLPQAERAAKEVLALPMFPEIQEEEQHRVVAAIAEFYSK